MTACHDICLAMMKEIKKTKEETLWENVALCACNLGVTGVTFAQWKSRGYVPPSSHYELVRIAHELGVDLTSKELHEQWKRVKGWA